MFTLALFSKFAYVYAIAKRFKQINTMLRRYQAKFKSYVNEMAGQSTTNVVYVRCVHGEIVPFSDRMRFQQN